MDGKKMYYESCILGKIIAVLVKIMYSINCMCVNIVGFYRKDLCNGERKKALPSWT